VADGGAMAVALTGYPPGRPGCPRCGGRGWVLQGGPNCLATSQCDCYTLLLQYLKGRRPGPFRPTLLYHALGDFAEYYWADEPCHAEDGGDGVTLMRSDRTGEVVGFKLHGVTRLPGEAGRGGVG
jgi:hypothetical protein